MDSGSPTTPTPAGPYRRGPVPFSARHQAASLGIGRSGRAGERAHAEPCDAAENAASMVPPVELSGSIPIPSLRSEGRPTRANVHRVMYPGHPFGERGTAPTTGPTIGDGMKEAPQLPAEPNAEGRCVGACRKRALHGDSSISPASRGSASRHARETARTPLRYPRGRSFKVRITTRDAGASNRMNGDGHVGI